MNESYRNQVYRSSGISTRGGSVNINSAPPSSERNNNFENDDDQTIQGLVSRPTTNQTVSLIDSYKMGNTGASSNYLLGSSIFSRFNSNSQSTSYSLNQRINKLIKSERKMMKQKQELIKEINCWCNVLPNDDCKKLLYHFIKILETELDTDELSIKKKEQINLQLLNVNKREKRTNDLKLKRNKMMVKLRDSENKVGDSPLTQLTKENLEELESSVEIVEDQFIRSVNNGLKNSIVEYVSNLKDSSSKFKDNADYFLDNYYYSSTKLNSNSNLQKVILQNKLNNSSILPPTASSSFTRIPSQENLKNYIALSPNQVGKFLDNKFDSENNSHNSKSFDEHHQHQQHQEHQHHQHQEHQQYQQQQQHMFVSVPAHEIHPTKKELKDLLKETRHGPPPPTPEIHQRTIEKEIIDANYIINSYSTPGSLAMRPGSQIGNNNHEWI